MRNETAIPYTYTAEETTANTAITAMVDAKIRLVGHQVPSESICNARQLKAYCTNLLQDCAMEEIHLICVNAQMQIICESCISCGSLSEVNAYPRNIATVALLSNAHSVFLTHNHPGGTCAPSAEDVASTLQIQKALKLFNIYLLDHIIVTAMGSYSMAQHGDFDPR